jgi:hypothetical protein
VFCFIKGCANYEILFTDTERFIIMQRTSHVTDSAETCERLVLCMF